MNLDNMFAKLGADSDRVLQDLANMPDTDALLAGLNLEADLSDLSMEGLLDGLDTTPLSERDCAILMFEAVRGFLADYEVKHGQVTPLPPDVELGDSHSKPLAMRYFKREIAEHDRYLAERDRR